MTKDGLFEAKLYVRLTNGKPVGCITVRSQRRGPGVVELSFLPGGDADWTGGVALDSHEADVLANAITTANSNVEPPDPDDL